MILSSNTIKTSLAVLLGLALSGSLSGAQVVYDYFPEDAFFLHTEIRASGNETLLLAPGVYAMEDQIRFNAGSNLVIEGAGSGLGDDATILDFQIYSDAVEDARALSVRGGVILRNMTIRNVRNRAADLRTGNLSAPSDAEVIFENVWFVDCTTGLKSTGGRTVGTAEKPMQVKNCVFLITPDFPFGESDTPLDFRDATYAVVDHCDFFNSDDMVNLRVNDPEAAPNDGPQVTVRNSIFLSTNGPDKTDLEILAGTLTLENSVLWDAGKPGDLDRSGEGTISETNIVVADPLYAKVDVNFPANEWDFHLQSGSPAQGLGTDGRDAGSLAEEFVRVLNWELF